MIQPATFDFLRGLKAHNDKTWFDANRNAYEAARGNFIDLVEQVLNESAKFDPDLGGLEAKKTIFRINRDVRFSKNKDPYKTNFGASLSKGGKNFPGAGYYLQIEPDQCFLGGGIYMPMAPELRKIRDFIDHHGAELEEILHDPEFVDFYGKMDGEQLKTAPKDFEKDHPYLHLLKFKSFTAIRAFTPEQAMQADFAHWTSNGFRILKPLIDYLNDAIEAGS